MRFNAIFVLAGGLVAVTFAQVAGAQSFNRVATLPNYVNNGDIGDETVSEIIAASADGNTVVYTDSELEEIGVFDITNLDFPIYGGKFGVGGSPTSVAVLGDTYALVGVDSSESFVAASGHLAVVDISSNPASLVTTIDMGGQPDSIAVSPDGAYAVVVIENERDEFICVGGAEDASPVPEDGPEEPGDITEDQCEAGGGLVGALPQNGPDTAIGNPAGYLVIVDLSDPDPLNWTSSDVDLTGLADIAATDPEPEFVDINADNLAVVTLQENNHIVLVDLTDGSIVNHFSAGTVSLSGVDATEDGVIVLAEELADVPREPDAVAWLTLDGGYALATANEGDLAGGSRGTTVFGTDGTVIFDSGATVDEQAVRHGHYPEDRSENKGTEPEAVEYGNFGGAGYLFLGSERGSFINVYTVDAATGVPTFSQLLPAPFGPEGVLAIPGRNLLLASGENDDPSFGVRSTVMIYELQDREPEYPQILSDVVDGKPVGWSALSGMHATSDEQLLAVWDSYYSESRIFTIDVTQTPAVVTDAVPIQGSSGDLDPEGITVAPDGTYWIASEGDASGERPNRLVQTDTLGNVLQEVTLPKRIEKCRSKTASVGSLGSGFEGVTVAQGPLPGIAPWAGPRRYFLLVAQQRGWNYTTPGCRWLDDDPFDLNADEPFATRIWVYDVKRDKWKHIFYLLESVPSDASWVGLSEITRVEGGFVVIERDNRSGDFGQIKRLVYFSDRALKDRIVTRSEKKVYDLLPDLNATNGWITDKPEGVAVTPAGEVYVVTDNDGVEDWSGETWFLRLGNAANLFE
jgi:DNA-binding beta-propeller fold protein YncE